MFGLRRIHGSIALLLFLLTSASAAEWSVPAAGNAFRSAPSPESRGGRREGVLALRDAADVESIYFHVDRPATVRLAVLARAPEGTARLVAQVATTRHPVEVAVAEFASVDAGTVEIGEAGYVRVDLQRAPENPGAIAEIRGLVVTSETDGLVVDFVKTNDGNMFYWGRRGPSVHLTYELPKDLKLQYAYSEITVPKGQDTIGSYFMANGFGEGYFGIQVNGPEERRVLFSVWSPFQTDNPRDIPAEQRIVKLGSGPDVRVGEFGNEGSGGQSFLVYPWKADVTYAFLTEVKPDSPDSTVYTSWFRETTSPEWRLMASFRRPKTQTSLRGFHSFLENFNPSYGHITRSAHYGNVWVRDTEGTWHECTRARFSVDPTGRGRHRLDYLGGTEGDHFFLRNCGFFNETGHPGEVFTRPSTAKDQPRIDFEALVRS